MLRTDIRLFYWTSVASRKFWAVEPDSVMSISTKTNGSQTGKDDHLKVELLPEEGWWGGAISKGIFMPFRPGSPRIVLNGTTQYNQAAPVLLSTKGRSLYSDAPFDFEISDGHLHIHGEGKVRIDIHGGDLRSAHNGWAAQCLSLPSDIPPEILFRQPQYCTWMVMGARQEQGGILKYARELVRRGYPAGIMVIDDTWQEDYGNWEFHPQRFPDPQAMMRELHALGFTVMLWVVPYVSPDSLIARQLNRRAFLIRDAKGAPAVIRWWNGASAALDLTNPDALQWFCERLDQLIANYGVAGFKFDGGDANDYDASWKTFAPASPNDLTELYNRLGLRYPLNEFRAAWKCNGLPLNQRLCDKDHSWEGLKAILSDTLAANLLGYPFGAPDMVAGGKYNQVEAGLAFDSELFIRSTQLAVLMAMIQFSLAPWDVLSPEHERIVLRAIEHRRQLTDYIVAQARSSARSGEPLIRAMEYSYPADDWAEYPWQFMLGDGVLVAPVIERGAAVKAVKLPPGRWIADDGKELNGPADLLIAAPLERLPHFILQKKG